MNKKPIPRAAQAARQRKSNIFFRSLQHFNRRPQVLGSAGQNLQGAQLYPHPGQVGDGHGDTGLVAMKVESLKSLEGFDPMTKAIAFKEGTVKVKTLKVPKFEMNSNEYGPFDGNEVELPTYAGVYIVLKRLGSIV